MPPPKGNFHHVIYLRVKYKDVFHMKNFYRFIHEWVKEEGYLDEYESDEYIEKLNLDKRSNITGHEIWLWWRTEKKPAQASTYYKYHLWIDYHIVGLEEFEIMYEGKKFKTNRGEVELHLTGFMETDVGGRWKKHWFLRHFERLYYRRIMKKQWDMHRLELIRDTYRLQEAVKGFLELKRFITEKEDIWHPKKGIW